MTRSSYFFMPVFENGTLATVSRQKEENLTLDQEDQDIVQPYAAYAPPGTPQV